MLEASYGTGALLGAVIAGHGVIAAVIIALVLALLAWALFHVISRPHEGIAAIVTFIVVLVVLLLL